MLGLYALDGLIAGIALAGFVASAWTGGPGWDFVKVGEENNLPTWYSSAQLLVVALVLGLLVWRDFGVRGPHSWALLTGPALFLFLSLDEAVMLHERLGVWVEEGTGFGASLRTGPWMFAYTPLAGRALWAGARSYRPYWCGRRRVVMLGLLGVAILGGSGIGLEFVASYAGEGSMAQKGLGFGEEIGEMIGVTTLLWAVLVLLRAEGFGNEREWMGALIGLERRARRPTDGDLHSRW